MQGVVSQSLSPKDCEVEESIMLFSYYSSYQPCSGKTDNKQCSYCVCLDCVKVG